MSFSCAVARRQRHVVLSLLIALGWAGWASAAPPGDPTEAPSVWVAAQPGAATKTVVDAPVETPVIVTGRSRKFAVIDGTVIKAGDDYKGSKVLEIKANRVVMEDAAKSLDATPDVRKTAPALAKIKKESVLIPVGSLSSKENKE